MAPARLSIKPQDQWSCKRSPGYWPVISTIRNFDQILPCCKIGNGQPRVIIYINIVDLGSPMAYASFKIIEVLATYGHGSHLCHVTKTIFATFMSPPPLHRRFCIKLYINRQRGFLDTAAVSGNMFENNGQTCISPMGRGRESPRVKSFSKT